MTLHTCIDCTKRFRVPNKHKSVIRCPKCYRKFTKAIYREMGKKNDNKRIKAANS